MNLKKKCLAFLTLGTNWKNMIILYHDVIYSYNFSQSFYIPWTVTVICWPLGSKSEENSLISVCCHTLYFTSWTPKINNFGCDFTTHNFNFGCSLMDEILYDITLKIICIRGNSNSGSFSSFAFQCWMLHEMSAN